MPKWRNTTRLHTALYRLTGGIIGHRAGSIRMLLLTTTGRKSGVERTLPLAYVTDGRDYVVVASNGGQDVDPLWWRNLEVRPEARVQAGRAIHRVRAHRAEGAERERLWAQCKSANPMWASYETRTAREIPVVVLHPEDVAPGTTPGTP